MAPSFCRFSIEKELGDAPIVHAQNVPRPPLLVPCAFVVLHNAKQVESLSTTQQVHSNKETKEMKECSTRQRWHYRYLFNQLTTPITLTWHVGSILTSLDEIFKNVVNINTLLNAVAKNIARAVIDFVVRALAACITQRTTCVDKLQTLGKNQVRMKTVSF